MPLTPRESIERGSMINKIQIMQTYRSSLKHMNMDFNSEYIHKYIFQITFFKSENIKTYWYFIL